MVEIKIIGGDYKVEIIEIIRKKEDLVEII